MYEPFVLSGIVCVLFSILFKKRVRRNVTNQSKDAGFLANQVAKPGTTNRVVGRVSFPALACASKRLHAFPPLSRAYHWFQDALTICACHTLLVSQ